jgi:hypothetical protein
VDGLPGGLTNVNLRVRTTDEDEPLDVVVRWGRADVRLLGIDRDAERANTDAAFRAGVGAEVVEYRPDLSMLVIGFLPGRALVDGDFADAGVLRRAADAVRRLHAGPRFTGDFDMFARQAGYLETVRQHGMRLPPGYADHAAAWDDVRRALAAAPRPTVPCNNDLLAGNFIDDGQQIWLIDYEYSGNNDPCFELGNIWSEANLSLEQLEELMEAYDGSLLRHRVARARLWGLMSKFGWTLWGSIQASVSSIDFDFWEWAMEKYERAAAEFDGPAFARLLDEAAAGGPGTTMTP